MSGGHFDYDQYKIQNIIDSVEQVIQDNKRVLTDKELQEQYCIHLNDYKTPESRMKYNYPDDIIEEFKKGVEFLKIAQIYAQRIDWLLSGDDGENSFRTRLKEELSTNSTQKELISKKDIIDYLNYIVDVVENKNIITNDLVQKVNALEEKYNNYQKKQKCNNKKK